MCRQKFLQIRGIDVDHLIIPQNTGRRARITVWDTKPTPLVIYEAVKGNTAFWAKIFHELWIFRERSHAVCTEIEVYILRNAVCSLVKGGILFMAPLQGSAI